MHNYHCIPSGERLMVMLCMYMYITPTYVFFVSHEVFFLQHLERLESECAQFHSTHAKMGDDMKSVSHLKDEYRKFLNAITVST